MVLSIAIYGIIYLYRIRILSKRMVLYCIKVRIVS